jgi:phosphatidylglycerophosphatase A
MNFGKHALLFLSTGFYIGKIPFAPGTLGSLLGIPVWFVLSKFAPVISFVFLVLLIPVAIWAAHVSAKHLNQKDPGCIVIDETAGMVVTLAGLPFHWVVCVSGFVLFRLLDIFKPFPIRWIDQNLGGGTGIVLDDILAGIIGNITLRIALQLIDNI